MKNLIVIIALVFAGQVSAQQALGEVTGYVYEYGTKVGALDARVYIDDFGRLYQARVDIDGSFRISAVPAGTYQVNIIYQEDTMSNLSVNVPMEGIGRMGEINFDGGVQKFGDVFITADNPNEIKLIDGNLPVTQITAEEIAVSPVKFDIKGLVTSMSSNVQQTADGSLVFRGARKGDMIYMVDGVKVRGDVGQIPSVAIGYMQVYTGGLPAKYGDTLGGVVVIESKSYFDLYRAWKSEQLRNGNM
ncbi:MAG: TonB-dependent receptor plug domain-containing protein [Flavobacteriales bacterium]|nr:TonB-dependent receptor plug domain-containing protein [Flavobacteriales bacterium]